MVKKAIGLLFFVILLGVTTACRKHNDKIESNTIGVLDISVDATVFPFVNQAARVFKASYPKAVIHARSVPGQKAINNVMTDSSSLAITARNLTPKEEKQFLAAYQYKPTVSCIAVDAVALIVNNKNKDRLLTTAEVRAIFSGKIKRWQSLQKDNPVKDSIHIVFDNPYSSTVKAIKKFTGVTKLNLPNAAAVNNNREVIKYVNEHPNALGIIGVNWISQKKDDRTQKFLSQIKVVAIAPTKQTDSVTKYYLPLLENLKAGLYPITRGIYIINRGRSVSLGTGFAAFLNSPRGQLLIERSGLVPARETPMIIYLKNEF